MKILDVPSSGSYQGITSSRNRFGQYRRTRAMPVQPRGAKQTRNRGLFTAGSSQWRGLSAANQTAWNDYAAQISRNNSLGSSYSPTGSSLFVGAVITTGNVSGLTAPPLVLPTYDLVISGMTYTDPTPGPEALTVDLATTSADNFFLVETSGPVSAGLTSAAAVRSWRSLPFTAANMQASQYSMAATPVDIITEYKFLFPSPLTGNVIWFRFSEIFYPPSGTAAVRNQQKQTFRLVIA